MAGDWSLEAGEAGGWGRWILGRLEAGSWRMEAGEAGGFTPNPTLLLGAPWLGEGGDARGTLRPASPLQLAPIPPSSPAPGRASHPAALGLGAVGEDGPGPAHPQADARGEPSSADEAAAAPRSPLRSLRGEAPRTPRGFLGLPAAPLGLGAMPEQLLPSFTRRGLLASSLGSPSSLLPRPK